MSTNETPKTGDGGPAFPHQNLFADHPSSDSVKVQILESAGMSLRAYMATKAMQGLLSDSCIDSSRISPAEFAKGIAERSVEYADALMVALTQRREVQP